MGGGWGLVGRGWRLRVLRSQGLFLAAFRSLPSVSFPHEPCSGAPPLLSRWPETPVTGFISLAMGPLASRNQGSGSRFRGSMLGFFLPDPTDHAQSITPRIRIVGASTASTPSPSMLRAKTLEHGNQFSDFHFVPAPSQNGVREA